MSNTQRGSSFNELSTNAAQWIRGGLCGTAVLYIAPNTIITTPDLSSKPLNYYSVGSSNTQVWIDANAGIKAPATVSGWTGSSTGGTLPSAFIQFNPSGSASQWLVNVALCGSDMTLSSIDGASTKNTFYVKGGNCGSNWKKPDGVTGGAPKLVNVQYINGWSVQNVALLNSPKFTLYHARVQRAFIDHLRIATPNLFDPANGLSGKDAIDGCNVDGIDFRYSYGVTVQRSDIQSDDGIAVKWMNANFLLQNLNFFGCHGLTFGARSSGYGDFDDAACNSGIVWSGISGVTMMHGIYLKAPVLNNYDLTSIVYKDVCLIAPQQAIRVVTDGGDSKAKGTKSSMNVKLADIAVYNANTGSAPNAPNTCPDRLRSGRTIDFTNTPYDAAIVSAWPQSSTIPCQQKDATVNCTFVLRGSFVWPSTGSGTKMSCSGLGQGSGNGVCAKGKVNPNQWPQSNCPYFLPPTPPCNATFPSFKSRCPVEQWPDVQSAPPVVPGLTTPTTTATASQREEL